MEMKTLLSLEKSQGLKFYHRNPAKEWTFFFFFLENKVSYLLLFQEQYR